ncbi:MAG: FeoA family protein [Limisphaerales bacterium]
MKMTECFEEPTGLLAAGRSRERGGARPFTCPLSRVKAGMAVRIKRLSTPPQLTQHLREIGFVEEQVIKLLIRQSNLICLVCNARLAVSAELAQMIIVEPLPAASAA